MGEIEPFVDAEAAATFLSLPRQRLLELARLHELPAHPIGRGKRRVWRFRLSELAEALCKNGSLDSARNRVKSSQAVPPRC